jgi:hypothetical protein
MSVEPKLPEPSPSMARPRFSWSWFLAAAALEFLAYAGALTGISAVFWWLNWFDVRSPSLELGGLVPFMLVFWSAFLAAAILVAVGVWVVRRRKSEVGSGGVAGFLGFFFFQAALLEGIVPIPHIFR